MATLVTFGPLRAAQSLLLPGRGKDRSLGMGAGQGAWRATSGHYGRCSAFLLVLIVVDVVAIAAAAWSGHRTLLWPARARPLALSIALAAAW